MGISSQKEARPECAKSYFATGLLAETTITELAKTVEEKGVVSWMDQVDAINSSGVMCVLLHPGLPEDFPSNTKSMFLALPRDKYLVLLGTVGEIKKFAAVYNQHNIVAIAATDPPTGNIGTQFHAQGGPNAMRLDAWCVPLTNGRVLLAMGWARQLTPGALDPTGAHWIKLSLKDNQAQYGLVSHLWLDKEFDKSLDDALSGYSADSEDE